MPSWLEAALRRSLAFLRTWAVFVALGVAPVPFAVLAWLSGQLGSPMAVGLTIALTLCAGWALAATAIALRYRRRIVRIRNLWTPRTGTPSRWLPNGDLARLALTNTDIEDAQVRAKRAAAEHLGNDATVWLDWIALWPEISLQFEASSPVADKTGVVKVEPDGDVRVYNLRRGTTTSPHGLNMALSDESWRVLVSKALLRESPLKATVRLNPLVDYREPEPRAHHWVITFDHWLLDPPDLVGDDRAYRLDPDGNLLSVD